VFKDLVVASSILFVITILILALHAIEWIGITCRKRFVNMNTGQRHLSTSILKSGLMIESVYYLITFGFLFIFARNLVLSIIVLVLASLHVTGYVKLESEIRVGRLWIPSKRRVLGLMIFDLLEIIVLTILCTEFYTMSLV